MTNNNSVFIFRVARIEGRKGKKVSNVDFSGRENQQLALGEYFNSRLDKRKAGARLHWGQHTFLKGLFYIYKFSNGDYTSSFDKSRELQQHVEVSINFGMEDIQQLLLQLKEHEQVLCNPPKNEFGVSTLQDQWQLHVEVKAEALAQVAEYFAKKSVEKDRINISINNSDVTNYKLVHVTEEEFKASTGGQVASLDVVMEGLFGRPNNPNSSETFSTVDGVRNHFTSQSSSSRRRTRRGDSTNSTGRKVNEIVKASTSQVIDCSGLTDDIPC